MVQLICYFRPPLEPAYTEERKTSVYNQTDSKVHGASMGPIWGRQGPGGPHIGPMNFAIWADYESVSLSISWKRHNHLNMM